MDLRKAFKRRDREIIHIHIGEQVIHEDAKLRGVGNLRGRVKSRFYPVCNPSGTDDNIIILKVFVATRISYLFRALGDIPRFRHYRNSQVLVGRSNQQV